MSKDDIEDILKKNNIVLENNVGYDAVYIAHMCLADFYGSSITEEKQMAQFIKDYVDDEDQQDGFIFNRFYADTSFRGSLLFAWWISAGLLQKKRVNLLTHPFSLSVQFTPHTLISHTPSYAHLRKP